MCDNLNMIQLLPYVLLVFKLYEPCDVNKDLLFSLCLESSSQATCVNYQYPESWRCDTEIAYQCKEDLETLDLYCEATE